MSNFQAAYTLVALFSFVFGIGFSLIDGMLLWGILFFTIGILIVIMKIMWNIAGFADNGIDVEAKNDTEYIGIQVKHWENNVGYDDVAKTLGSSSKFNKFIIISTRSGFTSQAFKRAEDDPYRIELWDSKRFKEELQKNFLK